MHAHVVETFHLVTYSYIFSCFLNSSLDVCVRACVCVHVHVHIFVVCPFCQLPLLSAENWCNERGDLTNRPSSLLVAPGETDNNVDQDLSRPGHGLLTTSTSWLVSLLLILTRLLLI